MLRFPFPFTAFRVRVATQKLAVMASEAAAASGAWREAISPPAAEETASSAYGLLAVTVRAGF